MSEGKLGEKIKYWQGLINGYVKLIKDYGLKLNDTSISDTEREAYERLRMLVEDELKSARKQLENLVKTGSHLPVDDGLEVAKWQKQAHPNRKSLPYRKWKKKYGGRFTKPEYRD